jgi:hypothetical protein
VPTEKPTFATIPFPSLLGGGSAAASATAASAATPKQAAIAAKLARLYSIRDTYAVGDLVQHPVFGVGPVTEIAADNRIVVALPDGVARVLVHQVGVQVEAPAAQTLDVGEEVDAYCPSPRCKADTTHTIISMYEDEIRRVQCVTCGEVHAFRRPRGEGVVEASPSTDETSFESLNDELALAPPASAAGNENLSRSVDELEMSVRTANCLQNEGIHYIGELVQKTETDMLKTKNFGRKNLMELNEILAEMGLRLGMDVGDWSAP